MSEAELKIDPQDRGYFHITDKDIQVATMQISISGDTLIAFHTEVSPEYEGQGLARKLLHAMISYVRANSLKVLPLCPYVYSQFQKHAEEWADIWKKEESE
jgi:predicted GNAT family acetyltransferase